jgi:hypothetical protein
MAGRRGEIEALAPRPVVDVEAARAPGMTAPQAIPDRFNAKGCRSDGKVGPVGKRGAR